MDLGTVMAVAGVNLVMIGWLKGDIWKLNAMVREDQKVFQAQVQTEMAQFRDEMKAFHREHAQMNNRILDIEMERKNACKTV